MNGDTMFSQESHLSDQQLLLAADGELSPARAAQVAGHLSQCWSCRARKQEIEEAVVYFVRLHQGHLNHRLPAAAGPRALLKAQLAEIASASPPSRVWWSPGAPLTFALVCVAIIVAGYHYGVPTIASRRAFHQVPVSFPEPSLTPGAVGTASREQICRSDQPKNRAVPVSLQRKIFEEYGISGAEPRAYEVDYLITPALGGADDIKNMWPQSNSSAVWNARVKDALEDHLHKLVCDGSLDLVAAQKDISSDWIAAYRKYFHTDQPLETTR